MDHLLLVNAAAGSVDEDALAAAREVLTEVGEVERRDTGDVDDLDAALAAAVDRRVVVCGGDGSLHLAVDRARAAGLAPEFGLLPLGTGNDLARGVGLPVDDPAAAAVVVRDGRPRPLDLLVADDGRVCVNALHAGVGAEAAERAASLKDRLSELAYPVGAVLAGLTADGADVRVEVDGQPLTDGPVLLLAVCNGPGFGGGATIAPQARPDDGLLDVVVTSAVGSLERAAFGVALGRGTHLEREDTLVARGREVRLAVAEGAAAGFRDDVDGELGAPLTELTWRVERHAWRLVR